MTDQAQSPGQAEGGTSALAASAPPAGLPIAKPDMGRGDQGAGERPWPLDTNEGIAGADIRATFAEESHKYIREYVTLADQKAGFFSRSQPHC
jgi:hypothetical protein